MPVHNQVCISNFPLIYAHLSPLRGLVPWPWSTLAGRGSGAHPSTPPHRRAAHRPVMGSFGSLGEEDGTG